MTELAIPGRVYVATPSGLLSPGCPPLPVSIDRTLLAPGTYQHSELTSGLLPGWTPSMLTPVGNGVSYTINGPGPYYNTLFWGTVNMKSSVLPKFYNCAFAGPNPLASTTATGCIKCYGSGFYQWYAEDCLIDAGLWMDPDVDRPDSIPAMDFPTWNRAVASHVNGIHGGRGTFLRGEITRVGDTVQSVQTMADGSDTSFTRIWQSWLHGNVFYWAADWADAKVQSDGNHADGFQFSTGQNFSLKWNQIGGPRDLTGYGIYNPTTNPTGVSYNSGDDAFNAGIMVSQGGATPPTSLQLLGNIEIAHNIFWGGKYCINHPQSSTRPQPFSTYSAHDNLYVRRDDGVGAGSLQTDGKWSRYVTRNSAFASLYTNERVIDLDGFGGFTVGEPIVFTNG